MPAATQAAKETAIVTKAELQELADAERAHESAKKKASAAQSTVELRRMQLAEKVLGIKTSDELKTLSPEQIKKKICKRAEAGEWKAADNAPEFEFVKTRSAAYPAWAKLFKQELGEAAAARITNETPISYSYRVEVA